MPDCQPASFNRAVFQISLAAIRLMLVVAVLKGATGYAQSGAPLPNGPTADRRPLIVGASGTFYPYCFINERGDYDGFAVDVLDAVARTMKFRVERVSYPGVELTARFQHGEFDLLQIYTRAPERESYVDFSEPLYTLQGSIFVRRGGPIRKLEDLNTGTFVITGVGSIGARFLSDHGLHPRLREVGSSIEALQLVNSGECAGTFITQYTALMIAQKFGLHDVVMLGEPLQGYDSRNCFAVHRGNAPLLARLNEGLAILHANGEYDRLYQKWFSSVSGVVFTREELATFIAAALAVVSIVATWSFWRQRRLRRHIQQLNAELEQRVASRTSELNVRVAEVEHLNQELGAFSYSVSHDLRAPLRNITGFLELLMPRVVGRLDPEEHRYMTTVAKEAARLGLLIDDLLALSRVGRAPMEATLVGPAELVEEIRAELRLEVGARSVDWKIGPLPDVMGDRALLRQVFENLLLNAVKFTRQRPVALIEVAALPADATAKFVTFSVRDNGAEFNPKYSDKLFGVFQRLHNQRDFEGTGIGLANVKRIVERHGGRVWAEGQLDHGATFYFTVPSADSNI
jgi:signal transduction histidine kinase